MPPGDIVLYGFAGVFAILILKAIYRRRESLMQTARWLFITYATFALSVVILKNFTADPVKIGLGALLAEFVVGTRTRPRRSRYIPRAERRKVIARYERRTGQRYNPKRHHI